MHVCHELKLIIYFWFPNRARRGLENKSYLDEGRMEKLEQMLKQTEQIANEAESKYEEVMYLVID